MCTFRLVIYLFFFLHISFSLHFIYIHSSLVTRILFLFFYEYVYLHCCLCFSFFSVHSSDLVFLRSSILFSFSIVFCKMFFCPRFNECFNVIPDIVYFCIEHFMFLSYQLHRWFYIFSKLCTFFNVFLIDISFIFCYNFILIL